MEWQKKCTVYFIGKIDQHNHYSQYDITRIKESFNKYPNIAIELVDDFMFGDTDKYNNFIEQVKKTQNNFFIFNSDVYQNVCIYGLDITDLNHKIMSLKNYGVMIPPHEFMVSIGTKEYAIIPELVAMMIPGTIFYPRDSEIIKKLPDNAYVLKYGLSSGNLGCKDIQGNGESVLETINSNKTGPYKNILCSNFIIIQPHTNLFERCSEWRFFVLQDKIISLHATSKRIPSFYRGCMSAGGKKMNSRVYDFIKRVVNNIKEKISKDYFFARIDLTLECSSVEPGEVLSNNIFGDNFTGQIYLNEIEPLGSGKKMDVLLQIFDDGREAVLNKIIDDELHYELYNSISKSLLEIINKNNLVGGSNNKLSDSTYFKKYIKYKNKYLALRM